MNEEKGGGRRQLEGPEEAPTVPRQPGGPGRLLPPRRQEAALSRPRFPPLSGGLGWPELPVSLGRGVRSEEQASQGGVGGLRGGGCQVGPGLGVPCPADPSCLPPAGGGTGSPHRRQPESELHRDLCLSSNSCLQRPR